MGALAALGIGLSVLFGVFLAVLAAEICYMLCCRRQNSSSNNLRLRSASRRVSSVHVIEAEAAAAAAACAGAGNGAAFAQEAALVGSFGGYPSQAEFVSKFFLASPDDDGYLPPLDGMLFTITEETKEEMEVYSAKPSPAPVPTVVEIGSTPPQPQLPVVDTTPFATPPTSPESSTQSSPCLSPVTAVSRFSVMSSSPASSTAASSPALSRLSAFSPAYWPHSTYSPSPSPDAPRPPEHAPLGVLFRRPCFSPHQQPPQLPPRGRPWPGHVIDFRHALPFSPPNAGEPKM